MKQTLALLFTLALALSLCLAGFAENMEGQEVLPEAVAPLTEDTPPLAESPVSENPPADNPSADTPPAQTPSENSPLAEAPSSDTPSVGTPSADTPSVDTPPADNPSPDAPSAENPSPDNPPAQTPSTDNPSPENPSPENPSPETPSTEPTPPQTAPSETTMPTETTAPTETTMPTEITTPTETTAATETTAPPATDPPATNPPAPTATESHAITKHPTSETVYEGGYAEFVARADNCINIIWHLQSAVGSDILAQNAPITFPGLEVSGLGSERLALNRIPMELDDWRVRAEFVYINGNSWSDPATITVLSQGLSTPTVLSSPKSASLSNGQSTSLQVSAQSSGTGSTLTYQWYQNTVDSNVGGKAILGATTAAYVPEQVPGTVYYYCAVRSSDGTNVSAAAKTACAAVSYPAAPTTQPTAATVPVVTQTASAATLATWGAVTTEQPQPSFSIPVATTPIRTAPKSNSLLVVIVAVIIVIALAGVIAALVILKHYSDQEDEREREPRRKAEKPKPRFQSGKPPKQQPRYQSGQLPPQAPSREENPEWDDLSDLDLSYYLDDEDDL